MGLHTDYRTLLVSDLVYRFQHHQINLNPGFQRRSVWGPRDRRRLIESIASDHPLPSVFLYRRSSRGKTIYDVIDGKQRIETILMFLGVGRFKRDRFDVKLELDEEETDWWDWINIKRYQPEIRHRIECFQLQTVEVSGVLSDIVDLFVRINSTGKRLTSGEARHARYYTSQFLKEADSLVKKYERYLLATRIVSPAQLDRMKGTELFSELLMSISKENFINKKTALDRALGNDSINGNSLHRIKREFVATANRIKKMFPDLQQTRLRNSVDYYSLFMLIWDFQRKGLVLTDRKRNRLAFEILRKLSTEVDKLTDQYRQAKPSKPQPPYSDYYVTVRSDTDSSATRQRRDHIIRALLEPLFEAKDEKRIFSPEQRRILWNSDAIQKCARCKRKLDWGDFAVDHVISHVRGGRTRLDNAQLMCHSCNSKKGGR